MRLLIHTENTPVKGDSLIGISSIAKSFVECMDLAGHSVYVL